MLIYSRSFADRLEAAEQYLEQCRLNEPPVYAEKRLKEKPIPEIPNEELPEVANTSMEDDDETAIETSIETTIATLSETSIDEEVDHTLATETDPLADSLSGNPIPGPNCDSTNEAQQSNPAGANNAINVDDKSLVPLFDPVNRAEVDELLDAIEIVTKYEGVTMIITSGGLPKPMQSTADNVIKRENDSISGNISFNVDVSINLMKQFI